MGLPLEGGVVVGDRYRLERRLGSGGMGVVWAAADAAAGGLVAVKVLAPSVDEAKRRDLERRLRREARAAGAVHHPDLCRILDVIDLPDGSPALVMEYLQGETLGDRLARQGRVSLADFAGIFVHVLAGVGAVHAHGIVHRDLKPENVFLVEGERPGVKVLDFGIAKLTPGQGEIAASTLETAAGAVLGTPCYMSPEQFGERDVDRRADVWSLGLIAYRALSGTLPTQGDNVFEVFRRIVERPLPPLSEAAPDLPADVTELVARMLARRREDRPGDLREVMEVFARAAGVPALEIAAPRSLPGGDGAGAPDTRDTAAVVDPMATTYDAVPVEARRAQPPGPLAESCPPPEVVHRGKADRLGWRRLAVGGALAAGLFAGAWAALTPPAPSAPPAAGPVAPLSAGPEPPRSSPDPAAPPSATPVRASPPQPIPTASAISRTLRPAPAAAPRPPSTSAAQGAPSAPGPSRRGGLVEDPPF
jgi:serine/threonine-protein kinase